MNKRAQVAEFGLVAEGRSVLLQVADCGSQLRVGGPQSHGVKALK